VGIKEWVVPQDKVFFDLFEEMAAQMRAAADHLVDMVEITHAVYELLNRTFITPIEPEEISRLATALDDILDYIDGTVHQMFVYGIRETDDYMIELSKLIALSASQIEEAVRGIRDLKNPKYIEERCIEVNRLENLADDVLGHALRELFTSDDAVTIIKLKDIYENLEMATDKCEDAANVLSDIAIRHS
jgi:uncharacterized protein Yka (UPF0111/DUF47 family)